MVIVCICGASGSGKTSLAKNIESKLGVNKIKAQVLALDSYYITRPDLPFEERTLINYDAPTAFDFELLKKDIALLNQNKPITTKAYDYAMHLRHDRDDLIMPPQVLILEGIHSFADNEILNMCDLRIYVDTDLDECLLRRMCRDTKTRDRSVQAIADQYIATVRPMFNQYIRFYRNEADICVIGGGLNDRAVRIVTGCIKSLLDEGK